MNRRELLDKLSATAEERVLLGRLCSLAVYTALGSFAIARIPRGKLLLLCAALLPMGLQLAASFSADTLVIGLAFAMLAVCLRCVEKPVKKAEFVQLLVLSALIGPSKAIYVVLVGLVFMIPQQSFGGKNKAIAAKGCCCLAATSGGTRSTAPRRAARARGAK